MRAHINRYGELSLEKRGKLLPQYCPHATTLGGAQPCGEWCPKFRAVKTEVNYVIVLCDKITHHIKEEDYSEDK